MDIDKETEKRIEELAFAFRRKGLAVDDAEAFDKARKIILQQNAPAVMTNDERAVNEFFTEHKSEIIKAKESVSTRLSPVLDAHLPEKEEFDFELKDILSNIDQEIDQETKKCAEVQNSHTETSSDHELARFSDLDEFFAEADLETKQNLEKQSASISQEAVSSLIEQEEDKA